MEGPVDDQSAAVRPELPFLPRAFARAGMFLAFLSATLVAMGLIATATGFSDGFLSVAAAVLSLDLFVGLASLGGIAAASGEDIRYLQGMNRLRHAYHEMVSGLDRYFVSSRYDDIASVLSFYGPSTSSALREAVHGFTTTPGMIGVICSAVGGALAAVIALLLSHEPPVGVIAGGVAFVIGFVVISVAMGLLVRCTIRDLRTYFPRTDWSDE
jgi:cytochrome c biogenesis protein CcdA